MKRIGRMWGLAALSAFLWMADASAQLTLVKDGKAVSRIVLNEKSEINRQAADLLQDFVQRISGASLPIVEGKAKAGDVVIGGKSAEAGEDGFTICTEQNQLRITSGGDKGSIYGVVTLLEKYMGVSYYAYKAYTLTPSKTITLPEIHLSETPAFRYRQSFSYGCDDPIYKMWFRLEEPDEVFIDNMWVHTFDRLMPSDVYGKEHPEYYSYINGEHRPGNHSQWCLTNPDVYDFVVKKLDSVFKANPDKKLISVSQNDGNNTFCTCENCRKVYEEEGSPAGAYIRFMNKLAERFPDKEISTLAYLFTMHPPKKVKPLPNVNIMLCDIDCKREVPLTDNASGREFVEALEGWSAISDNIFVWDYGINFDNMVSCFPNFHVLQKNIQLFKKNHATMHFAQVNGTKGTDFSEMRAYMIGKLMWDPYQNADSLMRSFMNGYYGAAAPYLYQYQKIMQGGLLASGIDLWIYDSPVSHKNGMLNDRLCKTYDELFDQAEAAVASDTTLLNRVQLSRLSLIYSELEIARTKTNQDVAKVRQQLDYFRQQCRKFGIKSLNERNNAPEDYCDLYEKRFLPQAEKSKALGAKVIWLQKPGERYQRMAETALTDGLFGGTTFVESWVGWEGVDGSFILDLGEEKEFSTVEADFLHQLGQWILLPKKVTYSISTDNQTYQPFGSFSFAEDRDPQVKFVGGKVTSDKPVKARYIKVEVDAIGMCPAWHYGVGHPAWFFMDEVTVL